MRRENVRRLYFEEGYSIVDVAANLGTHRNTVTSDVKYWIEQFNFQGMGDEITEFFYKQKSFLESQKFRLLEKLKTTHDFESQNKIEKLLFSLFDREMKFYLQFKPDISEYLKPGKKFVIQLIRKLALDGFCFLKEYELLREIITITKCDVITAQSIVNEMENLGLKYSDEEEETMVTCMPDFAKMCGYISNEEEKMAKQIIAKREEKEEQDHEEELDKFDEEFKEKYGEPESWSVDTKIKYRKEHPETSQIFT